MIKVAELTDTDRQWASQFLRERWAGHGACRDQTPIVEAKIAGV